VGETMVGKAAGLDQFDLKAAEQLIQLSGGDGGSESRSTVNIKCCGADLVGGEEKSKDEEVAAESHERRSTERFPTMKDGDRGKDGVNKSSKADEKGNKEEPVVENQRMSATRFLAGIIDGGEERRKRQRFRWLADIYRET
jgi:hypothetical protein